MCAECLRRVDDFVVGRVCAAKPDVLHDGAGEQEVVLRHEADLFVERFERGGLNVNPIHRDEPLLGFVKAGEQADNARFAGTRRADQRHGLARFGLKTNVFENPRLLGRGVVAEVNVVEEDVAAHRGQRRRVGPVADLWFGIEQLKNALGAGGSGQHGVVEVAHRLNRAEEHAEVQDERGEPADGDFALHHERSAVAEDDRRAESRH